MLITTGILRRFSRLFAFTCILTRTIGSIQVGAQLSSTYESWLNLTCDFPSINVAASTTSVWKVSNYNANIRALSSSRIPVVLSNHSARSWPATSWNLQDMHRTGRWSNLFGVVSLPVKEYYLCNASSGSNVVRSEVSLFFSPQEGAESSSNIRHSATGSSASPSQIVNQMTMLEFLNNISTAAGEAYPQEAKAWPTRRFLYSTEFDSLVEELQVQHSTCPISTPLLLLAT